MTDPEARADIDPGDTIVCAVHDPRRGRLPTDALAALTARTPSKAPIVVLGLSPEHDAEVPQVIRDRLTPAPSLGSGWADVLDRIVHSADLADLVILDSSCCVPPGWLGRLRAAAHSGDTVATASPLTPERWDRQPSDGDTADPDAAVLASSDRSYPRLQLGGPDCLYIRRTALQLLPTPPFDGGAVRGLIERWCVEVVHAGLVNVLADDLIVASVPLLQQTVTDTRATLRELDDCDDATPLRRVVAASAVAVRGLTLTIDGRSLNGTYGGTQRYALELITALDRFTDASLRVVVPPDPPPEVSTALAQRRGIEVISYEQAVAGVEKSDVVHRPQQVFSADDLSLLRLLGDRLVVTHQDLIAYHNPCYHSSPETWKQYRRITRLALAVADDIVFFSEAAQRDAEAEGLTVGARCDVVGIALDAPFSEPARAPDDLPENTEFILCLGADYRHKNRPFAIRVLDALRSRYGWHGRLVLAGGHVDHGSSAPEERGLLDAEPDLAAAVSDLGGVDEAQRSWLLQNARAVIVPSVVEGFGLMPLEAAAAGVPCLFAAQASLREVVSESLASLVAWDAPASAARVIGLLTDETTRREHVEQLREEASRWSWERLAGRLLAGYEQTVRAPYRAASTRGWQELERERALAEVAATHEDLLRHLGDRAAIARDDGLFTAAQQRGLLRVGSRPAVARATMWPFGILGSLGARD
jgi:glycosyltransferase involved in cell wall biosynthesis